MTPEELAAERAAYHARQVAKLERIGVPAPRLTPNRGFNAWFPVGKARTPLICKQCGDPFPRRAKGSSGKQSSYCLDCRSNRHRVWEEKRTEKRRAARQGAA